MALREFVQRDGQTWRVWDTRPDGGLVSAALADGWLTFECAESRRRLAPIPADWEGLDDVGLISLWLAAVPQGPRRRFVE